MSNYRKHSNEELEALRSFYETALVKLNLSIGNFTALVTILGPMFLVGGVIYVLFDGLTLFNFILLAIGGTGTYYMWRIDKTREGYQTEIARINEELNSRV